jgi:membrane associated rhomboid family serine protease
MAAIDIIEFLLGLSWALFGMPFFIFAWSLSDKIYIPLQSTPPFWSRVLAVLLLAFFYVTAFCAIGVSVRSGLPASSVSWNPMAGGVLIGLVLLVFISRANRKSGK